MEKRWYSVLTARAALLSSRELKLTNGSGCNRLRREYRKIDRIRHRFITGVVRVQVVSQVVSGQKLFWVFRIARRQLEVNHRIKLSTRADKVVDRRPHHFPGV